jgi:predicted RNA-binding protein with RPS1 domain
MSTDQVGRVVVARVDRTEAYGVYLSFEEKKVIVLIPDVSDSPILDLKAMFEPGQMVVVKILGFVEEEGLYKGTIKDVSESV